MATNNIVPIPTQLQDLIDPKKPNKMHDTWWRWFFRLQKGISQFLPALGSANQILGVNSTGTANEYKTLVDGNGIDITHAPGQVTFTVNQMELADILAYAARH
jgi:hypothetical protein